MLHISILHHKLSDPGSPAPPSGWGWKMLLHVLRAVSIKISHIPTHTDFLTVWMQPEKKRQRKQLTGSSPGCNWITILLLSKGQTFYSLNPWMADGNNSFWSTNYDTRHPVGQERTLSRVEFDPSALARHVTLSPGIKFSCDSLISNLRHQHSDATHS